MTVCVGSGRNSSLFRPCSAGGIFEGPLAHFGLPLPPFWLPSAPFSLPLAPFWLPFGALWLPFRSLLAPFGLLWHPFGSVVLLLAPTRANRFRKICFWAPETASQPQTPVGILAAVTYHSRARSGICQRQFDTSLSTFVVVPACKSALHPAERFSGTNRRYFRSSKQPHPRNFSR